MPATLSAQLAAQRIAYVASIRGFSINKLMSLAGLSKSVVDRMKLGNMPSADKLASIATVLDVPTDFLLGAGVFENWDAILSHKTAVLSGISSILRQLSDDLPAGVDELTLAKLVSLFSVEVDNDADGVGVLVVSPIPTKGTSDSLPPEVKKEPFSDVSGNRQEILKYFDALDDGDQHDVIGYTHCKVLEAAKKDRQSAEPGA